MPAKSPAQERLMQAAAHTPGGYGGVPQSVGKEFISKDAEHEPSSEAQRRAMYAAAEGKSKLGIPEKVGKEFTRGDAEKAQCAGILFVCGNRVLLMHRTDRDEWEGPGGHVENGETLRDAAVRETMEEAALNADDLGLSKSSFKGGNDEVDYTTFFSMVPKEVAPKLNDEHDKAQWFEIGKLPKTTYPGVKDALKHIGLSRSDAAASIYESELDVAKAIRAGELSSPQHYENIWMFHLRITGTGTSYRTSYDEYVYRSPEEFLSDDFVERCNGLPLIFEHPNDAVLNTKEFRDRSIGVIILPYIKGDEVWGIAKVYDEDAAMLMQTSHESTSPTVVFRTEGSTEAIEIDGNSVLIEGKPSYLDHLAICPNGVWDKGGEPSGIINSEDLMMDEETKVPAWADALMKRMDSLEEKGKEEEKKIKEEAKADSEEEEKKADAEEKEKEEEKADSDDKEEEKADSAAEEIKKAEKYGEEEKMAEKKAAEYADASASVAEMKAQIEALNARLSAATAPLSNSDRDALSAAQKRADSIAQMFGDSVAQPLHGESPIAYRKRLVAKFKAHSPEFKDVKLDSLEGAAFDVIESKIYADAQAAAMSPEHMPAGRLIPIVRRDSAGREVTTYQGDMDAWLGVFKDKGHSVNIAKPQRAGV